MKKKILIFNFCLLFINLNAQNQKFITFDKNIDEFEVGDKAMFKDKTEITGFDCQRNLSAGIPGDVGDIHGVPNCVIQVADWKDKSQACLVKPREVEVQRENAGVDFVASMVRFRGGQWRMVLTPEQFNTLLQAALQ